MDILMNFRDVFSSFSFTDHIFIAGGNGSGKSLMYKFMISGFDGKEKEKFLVDGTQVKKRQCIALGISRDDTLDEELKMTSKSYLYSRIETFREYINEEKLVNSINEYYESVKDLIEEDVFCLSNLKINFDIEKITSNIFKSIEYKLDNVNFSELSTSEKVNVQLEMYLNRLTDINDNTFLLIDDFDTIYIKNIFFEKLEYIISKTKELNTKCIFFVKNEDIIFKLVNEGYDVKFIRENRLIDLPNYENFIDEIYLYSEDEIKRKVEKIKKEKEYTIISELLK